MGFSKNETNEIFPFQVKSVRQIVTAAGVLSPIGLEDNEEITKKSVGYDEVDRLDNLANEGIVNDRKNKIWNKQRCSTSFAKRKQHKKNQHNEGKWIILCKRMKQSN